MRLPDLTGSRAVVIGTSHYDDEALPDLPSVLRNLTSVADLLKNPMLCGMPQANITVVADPATASQATRRLKAAATAATDMLLVYFAGHGILAGARRELHLGVVETTRESAEFDGLPYDHIRDIVVRSRARVKVIVLDCCYSGAAIGHMAGGSVAALAFDQSYIDGTYIMTATSETKLAMAPEGADYTAFTGELVRALGEGLPDGPELLSLETIYDAVAQGLRGKGLPLPQASARNSVGNFVLARNAAYVPPPDPLGQLVTGPVAMPADQAVAGAPGQPVRSAFRGVAAVPKPSGPMLPVEGERAPGLPPAPRPGQTPPLTVTPTQVAPPVPMPPVSPPVPAQPAPPRPVVPAPAVVPAAQIRAVSAPKFEPPVSRRSGPPATGPIGGAAAGSTPGPRRVAWTAEVGGVVRAAPVIVDGMALIASGDRHVNAFDLETGALRWRSWVGGGAIWTAGIATDGESAFIGGQQFTALKLADGSLRWAYGTNDWDSCQPDVDGTAVFVHGTQTGLVRALDRRTGEQLWEWKPDAGLLTSGLRWFDGRLYYRVAKHLYALDASAGTVAWQRTMDSRAMLSVEVGGGYLLAGSMDRTVTAIDAGNGELGWKYHTGGLPGSGISMPHLADGIMYVTGADRNIHAVDARTGGRLWIVKTTASYRSELTMTNNRSPRCQDGVVYVGSGDKHLYALAADTGRLCWKHPLDAMVSTPVAVADGYVVVTAGKQVVAIATG